SPPATAPATSPAPDRELTAVFVSTSPDSIVLRKWDSTEISFHVVSSSLMPKDLRAGDIAKVVYHDNPGAPPEAVRITLGGAGRAPGASPGAGEPSTTSGKTT